MTIPTIGHCPTCGQEKWRNDGHPCFTCSKSLAATVQSQRELIAALTKALEFYAAERHYEEETGAVGKLIRIPSTPDQAPGEFAFEADWGETARAALALAEGAQ